MVERSTAFKTKDEILMEVKLKLPMPPSINRTYRAGRGKFWMTDDGVQFKDAVRGIVLTNKVPKFPDESVLNVTIHIYPNNKRRRDLDSGVKITLDSLQIAGVYSDDYKVRSLNVERKNPLPKDCTAYIEVTISDGE